MKIPRKANERLARAEARRVIQELGIVDAPVDPVDIAASLGIVVKASDKLDGAFSGCLLRHGETFGILYSTAIQNDGFQRFTIGHELGHYRLTHQHEVIFANGVHHSASDFTSDMWFEREADHFSSELLIPKPLFERYRRGCPLGLQGIKHLAETFQTSLTATAIQFSKLTPDPAAVILSERNKIVCVFPSDSLSKLPGVRFGLRARDPLPDSLTRSFNKDVRKVKSAAETNGTTALSAWFTDADSDVELTEEIIGLGSYSRTLTVLWTEVVPDPDDEDTPSLDPRYFREEDGKRWRW